ncbi:MAG: hypothetical protein IH859_10055, partial [Chloroflexi bacterium]|nr:hypothetical protein [Chloroflexota bacterium]
MAPRRKPDDVIILVKGAGLQKVDDTLGQFIAGFEPAIKKIDPTSTMKQRRGLLKDYKGSPHEKDVHTHITEIKANNGKTDRKIWIKEAYWEQELTPSAPFKALSKEWRMASYALGDLLQEAFAPRNNAKLREKRKDPNYKPESHWRDVIPNFVQFLFLFLLISLPFANRLPEIFQWMKQPYLYVFLFAAIWAVPPALEIYWLMKERNRTKNRILTLMPGLPGWTLLPLILFLALFYDNYFPLLGILIALQITYLFSRKFLWSFREYANSDTDIAKYYSYEKNDEKGNPVKKIGKIDKWLTSLYLRPVLYRYIVLLTLPIVYIALGLSKVLKWTRVLRPFAAVIDSFLKLLLGSILGDVVDYAMDPAQAY